MYGVHEWIAHELKQMEGWRYELPSIHGRIYVNPGPLPTLHPSKSICYDQTSMMMRMLASSLEETNRYKGR